MSEWNEEFLAALTKVRQENIARLLIRSFRVLEERILQRLSELGHAEIRMVHLTLLRNIDMEGTRITDIADRAQLTKQAIGQLTKQCEEAGYVYRVPDPTDGRASIVRFTEKGRTLMLQVVELWSWIDEELVRQIGERRLATLKSTLRMIVQP